MLIELKNIQKTYMTNTGVTFRALAGVSATFENSGLVFLVGASGSGKSTLLNVIGGLDNIDSGDIIMASRSMRSLKAGEVDSLRNTLMGVVFQEFNLIDSLTVYENVKLALDMQGEKPHEKVRDALKQMGIEDKAQNKTKNLSGGQRQRVAIARALVKDPKIILADEPTGALDSATGEEVLKIFKKLSETRLIIVVTHDMEKAAEYGDRIIEMKDGKIYRDVRRLKDGEKPDSQDVRFVSDSMVIVDKDGALKESDVEKINDIVQSSAKKTYLNIETDERKMKALFPNLREAVDEKLSSDREKSEDDNLLSGAFVPYRTHDTTKCSFEYKKSRLPNANALRLGLNNLNMKKGRLILTIIMALMAFTLFGIAQSFTGFDIVHAVASTLNKEKYGSVSFINAEAYVSIMTRIQARDVAEMFKDEYAAYPQNNLNLKVAQSGVGYNGLDTFNGIIEINDVAELGLKMIGGSSVLTDFDSIIISQYAAETLLRGGQLSGATKIEDTVGKMLYVGGRNFKIGGVFDCDMSKNYNWSFGDQSQMNRGWRQIYGKEGFTQNYIAETEIFEQQFNTSLRYKDMNFMSDVNVVLYSDTLKNRLNEDGYEIAFDGVDGGSGELANRGDIFIAGDSNFLNQLGILRTNNADPNSQYISADGLNNESSRKLTFSFTSVPIFASKDFKIKGFVQGKNGNTTTLPYARNSLMVNKQMMKEIYDNIVYPVQFHVKLSSNASADLKLIQKIYDNGFKLNAPFINDYEMIISLMVNLKPALLIVAALLSLLVIFLLFNFVSTSIRLTKKQIGILRALGAKKTDTFKIYAMEGFLVTIFAFVLSCILLIIGAPLMNAALTVYFGYYFSLINIGAVVYLTMAAITLVVTVLAVLISIGRFNKITPISAISGKD